jgi:hypothetical protein
MREPKPRWNRVAAKRKLSEAKEILTALGFSGKQANTTACYVLLAMLDQKPSDAWSDATAPLRGITPTIEFIAETYHVRYAPNTRETVRDEAVKYFVDAGLLVRNPDDPQRPTNSGNTVYQIESSALLLCNEFGSDRWGDLLKDYLKARSEIRRELERARTLAQIPVCLPNGQTLSLSPGGQNPLIKEIVEGFCPRFTPGGVVLYIGDTATKFRHLDADAFHTLGIVLDPAAKMPDVVIHHLTRNWLVLIEAVATGGVIDGKRRGELKQLFRKSRAGLVFVTAFESRKIMQTMLPRISWETEVWVADHPDHLIHFNGERFLGPYPDVLPLKYSVA